MNDEVIEIDGIKLARTVEIGDLGSIVFPAARALLNWLKTEEDLKMQNVIGNIKPRYNCYLCVLFGINNNLSTKSPYLSIDILRWL